MFLKNLGLNSEGKISSDDATSEHNAIAFHKPIFARRIRINLNEPLKKSSFSIWSVKFFQKRTTMLIKNELFDDTQHFCMYVNTNKPREGTEVVAYSCLQSLVLGNNNEMFIYYNDSSVRHFLSKMCVGFNEKHILILKKCGDFNAPFTIQLRSDNTLYFNGYQDQCIIMDETKKISDNLVLPETEIFITSQADNQTFKKENIKLSGESYWHSPPGQKKITVQILFGKMTKGPMKGQYENIKIDLIKIDWIKAPKKFSVFTWKPGNSWVLRHVYSDYDKKISEIEIVGEEVAAVMLVLQESQIYEEFAGAPAYAIKEVSIVYNSMSLKMGNCANFGNRLKVFDFDNQNYHKVDQTKPYNEVKSNISIQFEKSVVNFLDNPLILIFSLSRDTSLKLHLIFPNF